MLRCPPLTRPGGQSLWPGIPGRDMYHVKPWREGGGHSSYESINAIVCTFNVFHLSQSKTTQTIEEGEYKNVQVPLV